MVLWIGALCYLLIGLSVFRWVVKDINHHSDCMRLLALAAPFIIVGYPYFLAKGIFKKK